jgi:hypothetical protein
MKGFAAISMLIAGASAVELTPENWDAETAGKSVFIKFLAPWCAAKTYLAILLGFAHASLITHAASELCFLSFGSCRLGCPPSGTGSGHSMFNAAAVS